jgi:hypothetical protein
MFSGGLLWYASLNDGSQLSVPTAERFNDWARNGVYSKRPCLLHHFPPTLQSIMAATTTTMNNEPFPFLKLPAELRLMVYANLCKYHPVPAVDKRLHVSCPRY